jgi:outer membrane receptor protein involved in Fe transport
MKFGERRLSKSVRLALQFGVIAAGATGTVFAQDAAQNATPNPEKPKTLETITVTGSHIRRVDLETSNPVVTIDRAAIQATGKPTLGDLVQQLPAMTGGMINPQVNNSGGSGSSSVSLRGLGPNRTLVLVDGHRVISGDINSIPSNMIERIEVLTDGASAVYGSDAIGGVVNFILRRDFQGAQFTANYGESDHNDGEQKGYSFTFGHSSDKGSIIAGVEYNKQDQIIAGARKFSKDALSRLGSTYAPTISTFVGGSSSSPYGHIQIPTTGPMASALAAAYPGCSSGYLARNPGASGMNALTDYHCYQNSGPNSDKYNYATVNLVLTPQERTNAFLMGTYQLGEHVSAYLNAYHNKTTASFQLAPSVFGTPYGAGISADSYYNPFGVDFPVGGISYNARLSALGNRTASNGLATDQVSTGFKGDFSLFDQDWQWDGGYDYGHTSLITTTYNLPNLGPLNAGMGPSFLDPATGQVTCGTPGNPIAGCTPFNPFALDSPASVAALQAAGTPAVSNTFRISKTYHLDVNGGLFDLPAGTVQLAGGLVYRKEYSHGVVDSLLTVDPNTGNCVLGSQCSAGLQGGYNVKEAYAEVFIPVLKDLPFIRALNVTIGDRYSKFSAFGNSNNKKFAVEWRPIDDLLLRGTMAEVFRIPNVQEVFGAPSSDAPKLSRDPCDGYTGNPVNPACVNVPTDGSFLNQAVLQQLQITTITAGSQYSGFNIKPEQGKTFDLGAVYSPSWLSGMSASVDFWHLYLNDIITVVGAQSVLDLCSAGQLVYCQFVRRVPSGRDQGQTASNFIEPTGNLGSTSVSGVDVSLTYRLPEFSFGKFSVHVDGTYLKKYDQQTAPGTAANTVYHDAGHFMTFGSAQAAACPGAAGNCLFPRWRGNGSVDWQLGDWSASWRMRYISSFRMGSPSPSQDVHPFGNGVVLDANGNLTTTKIPELQGLYKDYGSTLYHDVSIGYNIEPLNTRLDFGVNNLFDKQPPILYANNTLNANTDPTDFDLIGRYFWGRVTVKF